MADAKSPNTLFSYFNSNKKKTELINSGDHSTKTEEKTKIEEKVIEVEVVDKKRNPEPESKKRKKDRLSLTNQAKKVRLSQSSDENEADSGISSHPNSEVVEDVVTDDSVCEVSYLDFMTVPDQNGNQTEKPLVVASPEVSEIDNNQKSLMSFFSPKSGKKATSVESKEGKSIDVKSPISSPDHVEITGISENLPKSQEKAKKTTQMTFNFSGKGMKLAKQEVPEVTSPEPEVDDIIMVSPDSEKKESKEKKKSKKKKKAKPVKGTETSPEEVIKNTDDVTVATDVIDGNDVTEERDKPRRSLLDVMAEARQQQKAKVENEEPTETKPKTKRKTKAKPDAETKVDANETETTEEAAVTHQRPKRNSKRRNLAETDFDFEDQEPEPEAPKPKSQKSRKNPKDKSKSKRRKSSPLKSPGGTDLLYTSELVESKDAKKGPWMLRVTRLRNRQNITESKTTQIAQQILNKAKNKSKSKLGIHAAKSKVVAMKKTNEKTKGVKKAGKAGSKSMKTTGTKTKNAPMAAIFQKKKKLTKAELKALEEEEAKRAGEKKRRDAFLQGGIPSALRHKVAKSIQAVDSISSFIPFPGSGFDHTGYPGTADIEEDELFPKFPDYFELTEFVRRKNLLQRAKEWETGRFVNADKGIQQPKFEFIGPKKLSVDVVQSILAQLQKDSPDFPVRKIYDSLNMRRETELAKAESEEAKNSEVIALLSDDEKSNDGKKSKLKKKKPKKSKKAAEPVEEVVVAKQPDDVIKRNCDFTLTDMYAPSNLGEVIGNSQAKKRLNSWLAEWKERLDREERILKKQLEKLMKKTSKTSSKYDDDNDFDAFQCSDEEMSTGAELCNTLLIHGSHGVGKTSFVLAAAQELGYKVLELNATSRRNGKLVMSQLQEATQSQHVSNSTNSPSKTDTKTSVFFAPKKNLLEQAKSLEALASRQGSRSLSLILFDEVDIIFEEDKGFWQAIENFMRTTKKPMIMTTSDPNFRFHFEGQPMEELTMREPRIGHVTQYLNLVCLTEGYLVKYGDLVNLVHDFKADIRKCLNSLHVYLLSGGAKVTEKGQISKTKAKVEIPAKMREEMLSQAGSDDDFQPLKKKKKNVILDNENSNDALVLSGKTDYHEVLRHVGLFSSVSGVSLDFLSELGSEQFVRDMDLCDVYRVIELLRSNWRTILSLPKQIVSRPFPVFRNPTMKSSKDGNPRKRIISDNLYDDERSNDQTPVATETDDVTMEVDDVITTDVVKKPVDVRVEEFIVLDRLAQSYETLSVSDAFLPELERMNSSLVSTTSGLEDIQDPVMRNRSLETRYQMKLSMEVLNSTLSSAYVSKFPKIDPIPMEKNDAESEVRLRGDFDQTSKSSREISRCHSNVENQLGPSVSMDTSAMVTDYVPALRRIVKMENLKLTAKTKRRFFHYLDNISIDLSPSCIETLSTSF